VRLTTVKAERARLPAISLLLAGSLCFLPFLMPYHELPVKTFHAEWLAAVLGIGATLVALAARSDPIVSWPVPARWLAAFALFLAFQAAYGNPAYPQLPLLAALYVLYAVLMIWLGAQLTKTLGIERVAMALAAFLLAGALLTALSGALQFYGRPAMLEDVVVTLYGGRAYGNIAQANLYVNYLALGECALLFLWVRGRVPAAYALPALALLVLGSALSGSRSALLYALWFAVFGSLAGRHQEGIETRGLRPAAYVMASATLAAYAAIPWLNGVFHLGPPDAGVLDRVIAFSGESGVFSDPRPRAWLLALRAFAAAPVAGVGMGEFASAAFSLGLDPVLIRSGEIWTSPHNLPLHLLAEVGAVGTVLALGGLCAWGWQAARQYCAERRIAWWWIIAAVGVEMIHSMIEFPLWHAPFLGVTALLMGVGAAPGSTSLAVSRASRIATTSACAVLAIVSVIMLKDYLRLDATRASGTSTIALVTPAEAQRDAATMHDLAHGLMAPLAEFWILMGAPLDRNDLAAKSAMSERVARFSPGYAVLARRGVFLAFEGEAQKAQDLLANVLRTFPHRRDSTILILQRASAADPGAIEPLLRLTTGKGAPEG
jgi:hypothetical protein